MGKVIFNQFDQERAQIIVATDDGVVAAVSSETGELSVFQILVSTSTLHYCSIADPMLNCHADWRQTMRPFDSIDYMAFVLNGKLNLLFQKLARYQRTILIFLFSDSRLATISRSSVDNVHNFSRNPFCCVLRWHFNRTVCSSYHCVRQRLKNSALEPCIGSAKSHYEPPCYPDQAFVGH